MHESMYNHPIVIENMGKLTELGVEFVNPIVEEGAAKIAGKERSVTAGEKGACGKKMSEYAYSLQEEQQQRRLILSGSLPRAFRKNGTELCIFEAFRRGADVTLVHRGCIGIQGYMRVQCGERAGYGGDGT